MLLQQTRTTRIQKKTEKKLNGHFNSKHFTVAKKLFYPEPWKTSFWQSCDVGRDWDLKSATNVNSFSLPVSK